MNKIIPVICIIAAAITAAIAISGFVFVCVATSVHPLVLVGIPAAIAALSFSALGTGFGVMFFKNKLCRIALTVNAVSLLLSITAMIVWITAL